jgi:sulfite reductase alpha subunit-like flavoprotein
LLVALVKYKTILKLPRKGIATSWLAQLKAGASVSAGFTSGSMRLPTDPSTPIILIGPGTGIAPFRAFVQERLAQSPHGGNILVFFGCRSKQSDYYFQDEWEAMHSEGRITFDVAASRDQDEKVYVQHRLLHHKELVWDNLGRKNGILYISG